MLGIQKKISMESTISKSFTKSLRTAALDIFIKWTCNIPNYL